MRGLGRREEYKERKSQTRDGREEELRDGERERVGGESRKREEKREREEGKPEGGEVARAGRCGDIPAGFGDLDPSKSINPSHGIQCG